MCSFKFLCLLNYQLIQQLSMRAKSNPIVVLINKPIIKGYRGMIISQWKFITINRITDISQNAIASVCLCLSVCLCMRVCESPYIATQLCTTAPQGSMFVVPITFIVFLNKEFAAVFQWPTRYRHNLAIHQCKTTLMWGGGGEKEWGMDDRSLCTPLYFY